MDKWVLSSGFQTNKKKPHSGYNIKSFLMAFCFLFTWFRQ